MVQRNDGRILMRLTCVLMAIGAIIFMPAASYNTAAPATVMSSQSTQKPTGQSA